MSNATITYDDNKPVPVRIFGADADLKKLTTNDGKDVRVYLGADFAVDNKSYKARLADGSDITFSVNSNNKVGNFISIKIEGQTKTSWLNQAQIIHYQEV